MNDTPRGDDALHTPVLEAQVLELLAPVGVGPSRFADVTLGCGGHARSLLDACPEAELLGLDRDPDALTVARRRLTEYAPRVCYQNARFDALDCGERPFAGILADLGLSSLQLDRAERGFSFSREGPLDMRMGPDAQHSAADLVNTLDAEALANILYRYGEEPAGRKVAAAIVRARLLGPIETTSELAEIVRTHARKPRPKPGRKHAVDAATRSFQGLRIAVNDELGLLERALPLFREQLASGGRLAIIAFHSLEDRIVKKAFRDWERAGLGRRLTAKPLRAEELEVRDNPRARSARLRAFERA